jgi:ABC-2 type transport system permease protein
VIWNLYRKELRTYFSSPLTYVMAGVFCLASGFIFFISLGNYATQLAAAGPGGVSKMQFKEVIFQVFTNLNFLYLIYTPIFTMRLIAEERKNNTIELLFSSPISDYQIILGKYFASFTLNLTILALSLIYPIVLSYSGLEDLSFFRASYIALTFNILSYTALGLLASTVTKNQVLAAFIAVFLCMFLWILTWASHATSNFYLVEFFRYAGILFHYDYMRNGIVHFYSLMYYASVVFFSLFLTKKALDARNW